MIYVHAICLSFLFLFFPLCLDAMTPSSKMMRTGGRTPLFQALVVCLGAIEGRGSLQCSNFICLCSQVD